MTLTSDTILIFGLIIMVAINQVIYHKGHRNKKVLVGLFCFSVVLAVVGLVLLQNPDYKLKAGHAATFLFSPIIYVTTYELWRQNFKKKNGIEPAYQYLASWDTDDHREITMKDKMTFIMPFVISVIIPVMTDKIIMGV